MKYKYHAKCSQCGLGFRSNSKSDLLSRMRKHMWSKHGDWMRRRIKNGLRKAKKRTKALDFGNPGFIGFAERGIIEKVTGQPYEKVRAQVLDTFARMLMTGIVGSAR